MFGCGLKFQSHWLDWSLPACLVAQFISDGQEVYKMDFSTNTDRKMGGSGLVFLTLSKF